MNDINKFINEFKQFGKSVIKCFTEGNCYWFAFILKTRFPEGQIVLNNLINHFAFKVNDKLYDITGCCDNTYEGEWVSWLDYQNTEPTQAHRIMHDCIDKI